MWVVVYVAPNRKIALILKELLEFEGILVKFKGLNEAVSYSQLQDQEHEQNIEIMVSDLEIEEANEVINNALQGI